MNNTKGRRSAPRRQRRPAHGRPGVAGWSAALMLLTLPVFAQSPAGTTAESAIVLPGIADDFHGVAAEHAYLSEHFPTWHIEYQTRIAENGRNYDVLGMIEPDRTKTTIFFDITDWFGK